MFPGGMELGEEEAEAAARVIRSHNVFRYYGVGDGPHEVADFERELAAFMGSEHALCLNAGSSALICGLIGAGVGLGAEVIIPAYTWNATANAVIAAGAIPVPAEVTVADADPRRCSEDQPGYEAILPVHARGLRTWRHCGLACARAR
jgi:dTDP-4-amino-4,6-dideoxygalactose transaminase